jgi:hypothetical protein
MPNKKIWANFQRIIEVFTQKIVTKLSKLWVWDPGSEIRDPEKIYSGYRIQGSKRHRIPDPGSGSATLVLASMAAWSLTSPSSTLTSSSMGLSTHVFTLKIGPNLGYF